MCQARPFSCCSENSIENTKTWKERFCNKRPSPMPKDELKLVFCDPSDLGKVRTKSTPSKQTLMGNLEQFLTKWNGVESDGEEILTQAAKKQIENSLKMVVCATFQFRVDQTEMKHFTRALRRTFHDRGSVSGWH